MVFSLLRMTTSRYDCFRAYLRGTRPRLLSLKIGKKFQFSNFHFSANISLYIGNGSRYVQGCYGTFIG